MIFLKTNRVMNVSTRPFNTYTNPNHPMYIYPKLSNARIR